MSNVLRHIADYVTFVREEYSQYSASPAARVEAPLRCKHSRDLSVMNPEVKRSRSFIPTTLYYRRLAAHCWRTRRFFASKIPQKLWLDSYFPQHAPPVLYYLGVDGMVPVSPSIPPRPAEDLATLARERGALFLKPSENSYGNGATHIACRGNTLELNGVPITEEALDRSAKGEWQGYLVSEVIRNSSWSGKFYERTLNTARVLTGVCRDTMTPVILSAVLKIGSDATFPTDNWRYGAGGVTARIDLDTGRLGTALTFDPRRGGGRRPRSDHPETGVAIEGETVPDWAAIKRTLLDVVAQLPCSGLVGWDVALTPDGVVIVEGNGRPGIDIHEAHESLFSRPEQRQCLAGINIFPRGEGGIRT